METFGSDTKFFRRNVLILPPPPTSYEFFRHCETKFFPRKNLILAPPLLLSINFFASGSFLKSSAEVFLYEIFRHCETKSFRWKNLILSSLPLVHKLFRSWKLSETQHTSVPLRKFSAPRDKIFSTEKLDTPIPPSYPNFFDTRN